MSNCLSQHLMIPLAILLAFAANGCGDASTTATASLSGKVSSGGAPVEEGTVNLINEEKGTGGLATIGPGGSYQATDLVPGTYKIAIEPPMTNQESTDPDNPPKPKDMPNLPEKYRSFATSGLTVEVKDGTNEHNIELTADGGASPSEDAAK